MRDTAAKRLHHISKAIADLGDALGVRLFDRNTLRTRDLATRNIDFAVVQILEPFSTDEFAVEVLTDDAYIVYVGRNSKWAKRRNVRLADLVNERWVLPPLGQILAPLHNAFDAAGLERPRATVMTLSVHVHNSLLATGRFVTALPRATFGWGATYLPIKALKIEMPTTGGPIAIITLRGRKLSGAANLFLDCLRELVAQRERERKISGRSKRLWELLAHRDILLHCGISSLSWHSGLWQAERPANLWVHGLVRLSAPVSWTKCG
jgi:DNA-binding transcriptional LysR family regulator